MSVWGTVDLHFVLAFTILPWNLICFGVVNIKWHLWAVKESSQSSATWKWHQSSGEACCCREISELCLLLPGACAVQCNILILTSFPEIKNNTHPKMRWDGRIFFFLFLCLLSQKGTYLNLKSESESTYWIQENTHWVHWNENSQT